MQIAVNPKGSECRLHTNSVQTPASNCYHAASNSILHHVDVRYLLSHFTNDQVRYSILVPEYTEIVLSVPEEVSDLILEFVRLDHPSYYTALLHSCSHIKNFYSPTRRRLFRFIRYDPSSYDLLLVIFSKNHKLSSFVQILALDTNTYQTSTNYLI